MFTHKQVWAAIDTIADRYGFSASGLAKKSGLDPTSFNPSKRHGPDGRPRWPTTESIAHVLDASGASVEEFIDLLERPQGPAAEAQANSADRSWRRPARAAISTIRAFPAGSGWDEIDVPGVTDQNAYALEITGDSMLPVYREGDIIIVSPNATVRKGDRVMVKTTRWPGDGEDHAAADRASTVELASFNPAHETKT